MELKTVQVNKKEWELLDTALALALTELETVRGKTIRAKNAKCAIDLLEKTKCE